MIRCGRPRWDAKDKICAEPAPAQVQAAVQQKDISGGWRTVSAPTLVQDPALTKKETENALAKLLADRAKLDNFWSQ